jgi:hypothetical protein
MESVRNSLEYLDASRVRAALYVVNNTAYAHFAAPGNMTAGESWSGPLRGNGEYRAEIPVITCRLEVGPGQNLRRKVVRGPESTHEIT